MASNKQLSATITIGGAVSSSLKSAFGTVAKSTERVGSAITDLTRKQKLLSQSIQTFGRQGKDVESLRAKYAANAVAIDRMRVAQERLNRVESARERNLAKREGYKAGIMGTIAVGATVAVPLKQAMDFEDTLADIRKVANFDTPDGLLKMGQAIQDMSTRLPMTANDIGKIVAAGAQSGIATSELTKFAEAAVKMGVAFDISADEAGQSMAEMRSAFGMSQDQVNILADKINLLGNNTAASAKDILDITQRIGPLGSVAGAASGSIAAMGATLRGMGVQNEIAATGIKNLLLTLSSGKSATKAQQAVFKQLGYTATQVSKSMQLNADETIRVILSKISKLPKHMQSAALAQLFGKESIGAIAPMLTQLDQYQKNLAMVNDKAQYFGKR
ncbi:phage tail tape measure protein [Klebsiella pneumoniae]|nr:phage tail tape measure protein [Klebsiella pneumoniae]